MILFTHSNKEFYLKIKIRATKKKNEMKIHPYIWLDINICDNPYIFSLCGKISHEIVAN